MSDQENAKIQPVDFEVDKSIVFDSAPVEPESRRPTLFAWLGLGVLAILALAVIFVLPNIVSEYELPLARRAEIALPAPVSAPPQSTTNAVSPFEEAQRARQRKEAQDVLAELLEVQEALDSQGVESWAETAYDSAVELAKLGDEAYLQQEFDQARVQYQEGLEAFRTILDRAPTVLDSYLAEGEAALAAYDSALAREKFSVALELEPGSSRAQTGMARAQTLDEVRQLLDEGGELLNGGQPEQGRETLLAALDLDPLNSEASGLLSQAEQLIAEQRFSQAMSQGYAALQADRPDDAIQAFRRAASLGVNAEQAEAAILQTQTEVARVEIESLMQEVERWEQEEQWQSAISGYQNILQIDPNLVFAQQGLDYASKRLTLDQLLEEAIADPLSFAESDVFEQTVDIYYTGRELTEGGPRLQEQLDDLEVLLQNSQVPVEVNFVSDNSTRITLLRVREMGSFASQTLELKPGRYVAIGVKEGYKDVRQEFVVGFGQTPEAVVVMCDEQITTARGR